MVRNDGARMTGELTDTGNSEGPRCESCGGPLDKFEHGGTIYGITHTLEKCLKYSLPRVDQKLDRILKLLGDAGEEPGGDE